MHVALRIFIRQVLASQLLFLANRNAGQVILPLFWPVNCIKIGGHVALLSDPTVNCLYCGNTANKSMHYQFSFVETPRRDAGRSIIGGGGTYSYTRVHRLKTIDSKI